MSYNKQKHRDYAKYELDKAIDGPKPAAGSDERVLILLQSMCRLLDIESIFSVVVDRSTGTLSRAKYKSNNGSISIEVNLPIETEKLIKKVFSSSEAIYRNQLSGKTCLSGSTGKIVLKNIMLLPLDLHNKLVVYGFCNKVGSFNGSDKNIVKALLEIVKDTFSLSTMVYSAEEPHVEYKYLANMVSQGIMVFDTSGSIKFVNNAFKDIFDYNTDKLSGQLVVTDLIKLEELDTFWESLKENRSSQDPVSNEYTVLARGGDSFKAVLNLMPISRNGIPREWLGVFNRSLGKTKAEAEAIEIQQKALLSTHLASIGEMASGIAHEVNNPLASIVLYAQLLMEADLPAKLKRDVMAMYESAVRATGIIRRLLMFSRQQLQKKMPVKINDVMDITLELRRYALETSNIMIRTELDPHLPITMADAGQLQEVFLNIVLNAETEMKLSHGKGNLCIKTEHINNLIRISFKDDGPGIPAENIHKMFDPFFTTREVGEGTGLGLSICHGIVSDHGGRIYAESEYGNGATIIIELPVTPCDESVTDERQQETDEQYTSSGKILIVDDEASILDSLCRLLSANGYTVETIDNCYSAMNMIINGRFDCILLDIKLTGMSGIELYNRIKDTDKTLAGKIVFITGDLMEKDTAKFLEETNVPYFSKPFEIQKLLQELKAIVPK